MQTTTEKDVPVEEEAEETTDEAAKKDEEDKKDEKKEGECGRREGEWSPVGGGVGVGGSCA